MNFLESLPALASISSIGTFCIAIPHLKYYWHRFGYFGPIKFVREARRTVRKPNRFPNAWRRSNLLISAVVTCTERQESTVAESQRSLTFNGETVPITEPPHSGLFFIKQDSYQEFPQQILLTIGCLGDWADLSFWWVLNPILQGLAPNAPGQTREDAF